MALVRRPSPRRSRRPAPRRRRPRGSAEARPRRGVGGRRWSLEALVAGLAARIDSHAAAHPGDPPSGWLYREIDAWASGLDDSWRRRSLGQGLPIVREPACVAGCDHCCHQHVATTGVEAMILADHIRARWEPDEVSRLRRRVEAEAGRIRRILADAPTPQAGRLGLARLRRPCPLLDEVSGRCRAYEARPANCRRENSVDAEVCRRYRDDPDAPGSSLRLVRYDLIWGAAQVFLARWTAEHLDIDATMPLEIALARALGGWPAPD